MNALQDPSKKTSINSLLNPQEASGYPAHLSNVNLGTTSAAVNHGHPHQAPPMYPSPYAAPANFHLRAANWDAVDDTHKRKVANGAQSHRHYQQHLQMALPPPSDMYADPHASRNMMRARMDDSAAYPNDGHVWQPSQQPQHPVSDMPYGGPVISAMYSDERTALSGDYQSQSNYATSYTDPSGTTTSVEVPVWQQSERVSVRLAARGTAPEPPQTSQDVHYAASPYYAQPNNIYTSPPLPQHNQQPLHQQVSVPGLAPVEPNSTSTRHSGSSSSSSSKRQLPESEISPAPKAKRAKPKAKAGSTGTTPATNTAGASKRGYNAKKRSEAAAISAQNADALQRAGLTDKGKGRNIDATPHPLHATPSGMTSPGNAPPPNADPHNNTHIALVPELQFARCMSNRYRKEEFPRCVSCTRRWAGDTCRFQGIRYFLRDPERKLVGISFGEHHAPMDGPAMQFPIKWNRKFKKEHIKRTKLSIAQALLPTLKLEMEHLKTDELVRRPRESEVRATCDTCMTSLFSTSWMCRLCGREVCSECFAQVRELTCQPAPASAAELAALQGRREKHAHSNPFFLSCTKRNEHGVREFTPVTRFGKDELSKAIVEMEVIMKGHENGENVDNGSTSLGDLHRDSNANGRLTRGHRFSSLLTSPPGSDHLHPPDTTDIHPIATDIEPIYDNYIPKNVPTKITDIPTYQLQVIPAALYDPHNDSNLASASSAPTANPIASTSTSPTVPTAASSFASLWMKGLPILVKDVLPRFKLPWTPEYFIERYGDQSCLIIECQTDMNKRVMVREFFEGFGKYDAPGSEASRGCWKLKDWPPSTDFKTTFPELFEDFSNAVPVPDYVRRDGVFNIGSHFPANTVGPDLGPKMYNSMASSQEPGSKGSTRLHMDMADALNVMLYATKCEDGSEGYAVWDLFRAEDSDKLRAFLRRRFGVGPGGAISGLAQGVAGEKAVGGQGVIPMAHDPIHGQQFYLDVDLRRALFEESGVKSYRVYQRPGDGVFIPAGCAHQVANMSDCMKIAIDFVSPENIDRCEKLTKEFREQNQSKVWKEDVLQLRTMMWFAWQNCCIREAEMDKEYN
ncbi:hypothetical protein B0H34DRAFT_686986 [Crassisporium funariophilum]|nr:hypothetical protein B0H34DRAFT_686986 [Crassisporium funariophilum]